MQRRKSFFNNEMEQRFSLRKYTIGLCSACLGFVTIGMGSQSVKADTVNNVEKSSVVQENKMQDADSATAKPNITPTETKKNEVGSVATTAPKTNTTSNGVKANTADSAISTETKPTKANSTLANSNIVSAQAKSAKAELVVPKVGATSTKIKLQETKLAKSSDANEQSITITYVDDDEKGQTVGSPVTITGKTGQTVATNITAPENYNLSTLQNPLPKQITFTDKAIDPIIVHLKHQTEYRDVTKYFKQSTAFSLSGPYGAFLTTPSDGVMHTIDQIISIKGTRKYDLVTRNFIGETTWDQDHSHIYQGLDAINSFGDLDKTYVNPDGIYGLEVSQNKDLKKLFDGTQALDGAQASRELDGSISTQTWLKDELHADGYYLSEKTSLVFDGKSWLNLKEYQEKVDPNFTWTTTNDSVVMQGDHAVDHINPETITSDLLTKLAMVDPDLGRRLIYLNYVPYTYKHHSAKRTINIHLPNGEVKTITQNADAKQPVFTVYTYSDARNDKSASQETGNWTSGEWAEYDAPVVAGYTAGQPTVSAKTVTGDTQNETIDITYVASEHTSHVKLVDNDNKTIQDTPVTGKTGETANVSVTVPKGWQLVSGQELPTQISFNAEGHPDVIVQIEHKTIKVTPDNPKENGTVLPDNPSVHFNGVSHDDLNKTVTREITITDPTGKKSTTTQTVTFTRGATVDEVTNKVTYDDWSENGKHTFNKVDVPTVPGYTVSGEVPEVVVTPETQSSKVDITYTANAQTATITYIDDTEKKSLGSDKQNGKFNQVITFEHDPAEVIKGLEEKGYKLVSDNFKSGVKYQNDNKSNSFEVHLVHSYEPVETSQTITETVHYIDANGKPVTPDHVATVVVKVTGTRDKVTDSITWNTPSTGHFDKVISPKLTNMIPDKKLIPGRDVQYGDSDITESVVYTPDEIPSKPEEPNKPDNSASKTPEKPNKPSNSASKTSEKPNKPSNLASKTSEKSNKSSKEVSKQFGTIAKTTIPEKLIDSRTVDNHVSAKSTAKQELPQTGATTNTAIWTGLVSTIAGLGLVGASKKRKKN